tara:strand:- start:906 stop:2258 length:1353 start_codon:yes stop_codon:yes gene_type:complete
MACPYLNLPPSSIGQLWESEGVPGISIERRGRGFRLRWREFYEDNSSVRRSASVGSWNEAKLVARRAVENIAAGVSFQPKKLKRIPTLGELKDRYIANLKGAKQPGTIRLTEIAVRQLLECIGGRDMLLTDLRTSHMDDFRTWLIARGGKFSTINQRLSHAYRWWSDTFDLFYQDWPGMARPIRRKVSSSITAPEDKPILPWSQVDLAIPWLSGQTPIQTSDGRTFHRKPGVLRLLGHRAFMIQRGTALRIRQVCELQWHDIDFDRKLIHVHRGCKSASEKRGRWIPLPDWLGKELMTWERVAIWPVAIRQKADDLRFGLKARNPCSRGDIHWVGDNQHRREALSDVFRAAWKHSGVPKVYWKQRPSHLHRHTFGTWLARLLSGEHALQSLSAREVVEYHLGHSPGLHGTYVRMWEAYEHDLRKAALGFPAPGTGTGEGKIVDLRTNRIG